MMKYIKAPLFPLQLCEMLFITELCVSVQIDGKKRKKMSFSL